MRTELNSSMIYEYHHATGCPLMRAKALLEGMSPTLRSRVFKAIEEQGGGGTLRDPIENEPLIAATVEWARTEAEKIVRERESSGKGTCHAVWREQARLLREKHQVQWFSPKEMNPDVAFD